MTDVPINRVLVANRGEIALRVVRTLRDLGVASVLPYTPADLMSPAAELADEAYALPEEGSYNDAQAILDLAQSQQVDAIHPGYGFLSEDAGFAQAVMDAGIVWIGPSPSAMRALGDKMSARATAQAAGVAPVPGVSQGVTQARTVLDFAAQHGYPVALKRTDGGGGRGITVLADAEQVRSTPACCGVHPRLHLAAAQPKAPRGGACPLPATWRPRPARGLLTQAAGGCRLRGSGHLRVPAHP